MEEEKALMEKWTSKIETDWDDERLWKELLNADGDMAYDK